MSERGQIIMIWWALVFLVIFGVAWWALLGMVPTLPAVWTPAQVATYYALHAFRIKIGAVVASWTSAFLVPYSVVISVQMARLEKGLPVWSILAFGGGILASIFFVLPPIFWGVAAFSPDRLPDATALMNDLANLSLTSTDQFFIFQMIGITYLSLNQTPDPYTAFPRLLGWFTLMMTMVFELGALSYLFKTGPFAWNGLIVFWLPLPFFGVWMIATSVCMLGAIKRQAAAPSRSGFTFTA